MPWDPAQNFHSLFMYVIRLVLRCASKIESDGMVFVRSSHCLVTWIQWIVFKADQGVYHLVIYLFTKFACGVHMHVL